MHGTRLGDHHVFMVVRYDGGNPCMKNFNSSAEADAHAATLTPADTVLYHGTSDSDARVALDSSVVWTARHDEVVDAVDAMRNTQTRTMYHTIVDIDAIVQAFEAYDAL